MTASQNEKAERKTKDSTRTKLGERYSRNGGSGLEVIGREGQSIGNNQNQIDNPACSNSVEGIRVFPYQASFGKIAGQLRNIRAAHLAYLKEGENKLRTQLEENLAYQQQIIDEIDKLETELSEFLDDTRANELTTDKSNQ